MKQTLLTLVRNSGLVYPHTDADYEVLSGLGVPMNNLSSDFIPALLTYLPSTIKPKIIKFDQLEAEMLVRFKAKWKQDVTITVKAVTLTYPKDTSEALVTKATASLKKWYRGHFYRLDVEEKKSGRSMKTVLTKVLTPRRET